MKKVSKLLGCIQNIKTLLQSDESWCTKCNFETISGKYLNSHITRKHTDVIRVKFPKNCDLCAKEFGNMKIYSNARSLTKESSNVKIVILFKNMKTLWTSTHMTNINVDYVTQPWPESPPSLDTHLTTCEILESECAGKKEQLSIVNVFNNYGDPFVNTGVYLLKILNKLLTQNA